MEGNHQKASDALQAAFALPLSPDGYALLLRDALGRKRIGAFGEARERLRQVIALGEQGLRDASLPGQARVLLDRVDYDEAPGSAHERLSDDQHRQSRELQRLLTATPSLREQLESESYGPYLPVP